MELNELRRQILERRNFLQQEKREKLYSGPTPGLKEKTFESSGVSTEET